MNKLAVIGAGYVGLVTGACFAKKKYDVTVIENNPQKIETLLKGQTPFFEPKIDQLIAEGIKNKKLSFTSEIKEALLKKPQAIFSCVGTPSLKDGSVDLSYVWQVAVEIGRNINNYCLIVNKSTSPIGTTKKIQKIIKTQLQERNSLIEFDIASNPEFLKQGDAVNDFLNPDRIIVGVENKKVEKTLRKIYEPFIINSNQFMVLDMVSAELVKYASNVMLATRISFMNQLALLADKVGADINQVKIGMSKDKRIGPLFLNAGVGYGGSCFPKDVKGLIAIGKEYKQPMSLAEVVDDINNKQRSWFTNQILNYYGSEISLKHIGIWGLTFKPETDDLRCTPSIDIINVLLGKNVKLTVYDSIATEHLKKHFGTKIKYAQTSNEILTKCDSLIISTEWEEFLKYNPEDFTTLKDKVVFDGRNCFEPTSMFTAGIRYFCVGRNSIQEKLLKLETDQFKKISQINV